MPKPTALPDYQFQNQFYAGIRRHSDCAARKLASLCAAPVACVKCLCMPFFLGDDFADAQPPSGLDARGESPVAPLSPKRYATLRPAPPEHRTSLLNVLEPLAESPQHSPTSTQPPTPQTIPAHTLLYAARKGKQRMRTPDKPIPLTLLRVPAPVPDEGPSVLPRLPR